MSRGANLAIGGDDRFNEVSLLEADKRDDPHRVIFSLAEVCNMHQTRWIVARRAIVVRFQRLLLYGQGKEEMYDCPDEWHSWIATEQ